jgi:CubicO group peptidase (beta-lactamase class C family)
MLAPVAHRMLRLAFIAFFGLKPLLATAEDMGFSQKLSDSVSAELSERELSVIVAVSTAHHPSCQEEFGTFAEDGLSGVKTLVDLGSITKTVTAAALLTLVGSDQIKLSTRLDEVFRDIPADKAQITIRQLLTHRAGFPESIGSDEEKIGKEDYLSRLFATPLLSQPGQNYRYSNVGYSLLAALIEQVSKSSYETYLNSVVLAPNNLDPIGYELAYDETRSAISGRSWLTYFQKAPIHKASWGGSPVGWNLVGNGGAVASPANFSNFLHALFAGRIVSRELLHSGFRDTQDEPSSEDYGFGMVKIFEGGKTVFTHNGGNDLFSAEWRFILEDETLLFTAGLGEDAFSAMNSLVNVHARAVSICALQ